MSVELGVSDGILKPRAGKQFPLPEDEEVEFEDEDEVEPADDADDVDEGFDEDSSVLLDDFLVHLFLLERLPRA